MRAPKRTAYQAGPFTGLRDSLDPTSADPKLATLLQNVYPLDPMRGSAVVGRPGFSQSGSQLGAVGARAGQLVHQFTKQDGTEYVVVIVGGKFYTFNWTTRAWTEVVSASNFATASITLSATAKCFAVTFTNKMIVSDGVNTPWMWDGASGAGGLTKLTNAPVIYGQPWIYYAKLFGIKNTTRTDLVWSEENLPNTGYEAGGYNNAWTLGQTDQEPLNCGIGTNEAIYYFRNESAGVISGAVTSDFKADGQHDSISGVFGSMSPAAVVYHEESVFFLDANARLHVVTPGAGARPIWEEVRETVSGLDRTYVASAVGCYHPTVELILFGVVELGQTIPSVIIAVNPKASPPVPVALWRGFTFQAFGVVKDASGRPVLMHLSNDGYAYDHGLPDGTVWNDNLAAGVLPIEHKVTPNPVGDDDREKNWTRLDLFFRVPSAVTNLSVGYETPRGISTPQTASLTGSFSRYDIAVFDTDKFSNTSLEQHLAVGLNGFGRWMKPTLQHSYLGEQFGLEMVKVTAVPLSNEPGIP